MKKYFLLFLTVLLLFVFCGCAKKDTVSSLLPEDPLLTIDGQVVMTVLDFQRLLIEQQVSADVKGTEISAEDELFIKSAERYILSYFAELYNVGYDKDSLYEEFDNHMEELSDEEIYGTEKLFSETLQQELGLGDDAYKEWAVSDSLLDYNVSLLLEDIADVYGNITDPIQMEEYILQNVYALFEVYDIELSYPGVKASDLTFVDTL